MPNFTRFTSDPQFAPFAEVAAAAEKIYAIDPAACVLNCRQMDVLRGRRVGYAL